MKILILGDGLLGTEIEKQTSWDYISRRKNNIDFCDIASYKHLLKDYNVIINCIGYTKTYSDEKKLHWDINYKGVAELSKYCNKNMIKLVHISTDYIYANSKENSTEVDIPVHCSNWYGYTKLLGDAVVQLECSDYLLIRTSFKPRPFPYNKAIISQTSNVDYVDVISKLIISLIYSNAKGIYNVGTQVKTIYDLAVQTMPNIEKSYEILHESMPTNVSMDVSKMNNILEKAFVYE